ncbi:sulfate permease [bacterium]|nr:sulfate permease [bacterium]
MTEYFSSLIARTPSLFTPTFLRSGHQYSWEDFHADCIAGMTVAVIQIPQSMALAIIAGLPAVYGLYASLPGFIASLWGSSRHLSTGPVAIVSFLTLTSLLPFAEPGTTEYIQYATMLALMVGLIYLLLGVTRLGFIVHLVPHSVIVGFSSAAASIIILTQIPTLLGLRVQQHDLVFQNILDTFVHIPGTSLITLLVGISAIAFLVLGKRLPRTFPAALIVLVSGIMASYFLQLESWGVALVKTIPSDLPTFTIPWSGAIPFFALLPKAAIIALVGFVEAYAISKSVAEKTKQKIDVNQELVGQGLANIAAGFFRGYPMSGSFTRTAVNVEAGAHTGIASLITALITALMILFFTPLFYYLPRAVLGAIIVVSVFSLINFSRLRSMYHVSKSDGIVAFLTFTIAFLFKPDDAIFVGVLVALFFFIHQTVWGMKIVEMGVDERWNVLRGIAVEPDAKVVPGVCITRIGTSIYYANAQRIADVCEEAIGVHEEREKTRVKHFAIDASGMNYIDITGLEILAELLRELKHRHIQVYVLYLRKSVEDTLRRSGNFPAFVILNNIEEMRRRCNV